MEAIDSRLGGDDFVTPDSKYIRGVQVAVPDVTGQTLEQAKAVIEGAGFVFQDGGTRASDVTAGLVVATDPGGGSQTSKGATITVFTSDGSQVGGTMPNLTGQRSDVALQALAALGVNTSNVTVAYTASGATVANTCLVSATDPAPGATASVSSPITLTLFSPTGAAPATGCPQ